MRKLLWNKNFYEADIDSLPKLSRYKNNFLNSYPKHFFYHLIIKKLEWLLRENNIKYCIPFISEEFINCAKNTKTETKEEYKQFVKDYLPKVLSNHFIKYGGMVSEKYFIDDIMYNKLRAITLSPKYDGLFLNDGGNLRIIIYKMYVVLFNYIYIEGKSIDIPFEELLDKLL